MSAGECQSVVTLTINTLAKVRSDEAFSLFWDNSKQAAKRMGIGDPVLQSKRYFFGKAPSEFPDNAESHYRQIYFHSIDTVINCIKSRFQQNDYLKCYARVESLLLSAAKGEPCDDNILFVCNFYGDDLDKYNLKTQLQLLETHFESVKVTIDINLIVKYLRELTQPQKLLFSEVVTLIKILLVAPATNAISERSCSTMRRIKTYLRTTMTQSRLNHCMLLNTYKEAVDKLNLVDVANEFCRESEARINNFGTFSDNDITQKFNRKMSVATQTS